MPIQEQILEVLKKQLLPEIAEIKAEQQEAKNREIKMGARLDIIEGRLDQMDKRFDQMDDRFDNITKEIRSNSTETNRKIRELHEDLREVRSYVFVSKVGLPQSNAYQVHEPPSS